MFDGFFGGRGLLGEGEAWVRGPRARGDIGRWRWEEGAALDGSHAGATGDSAHARISFPLSPLYLSAQQRTWAWRSRAGVPSGPTALWLAPAVLDW